METSQGSIEEQAPLDIIAEIESEKIKAMEGLDAIFLDQKLSIDMLSGSKKHDGEYLVTTCFAGFGEQSGSSVWWTE